MVTKPRYAERMNVMSYPAYSRAERFADGAVHIAGVALAAAAISWLFVHMSARLEWGTWTALAVYSVALLTMLAASGAYHILSGTGARAVLRRLDHAAIYVKIAGTFTPLAVLLGTVFGYLLLGLVWTLALAGAGAKLLAAPGRMTTGFLPQLALGWLGLVLLIPLAGMLPTLSLGLIVTGGGLYSLGIVFYAWEKLRFANAIWHLFVLAASGCFFAGIVVAVAAQI